MEIESKCCLFLPILSLHLSLSLAFTHLITCSITFRTVPTIVIAHTFCASPDTQISFLLREAVRPLENMHN